MERRGIGVIRAGPRLAPPDDSSHAFSDRTAVPEDARTCCSRRLPYALRRQIAQTS